MPDPGPAIANAAKDFFNCLANGDDKLERREALELTLTYLAELLDPERSEGEGVG